MHDPRALVGALRVIPLFTVYRSAKRRRSRRSAANSSNVSNQPLRRTGACPPGYPHHTLSNVTARRIRVGTATRTRRMPRAHRGPGAASPGNFARPPWPNDAAPSSPSPYLERNRHDDRCARTARITACFTARRAASCNATDSGCVRCRPCGTFDASFAFQRIPIRCIRSRPPLQNPGRSSTRGRRRARIRRFFLLLSHRRSSAPRRPLRRHAPADQPASVSYSIRPQACIRAS